jgi:hypothetical protein
MNFAFLAAAAISLVTFGVHLFVGGIYVVRPLLAAQDITAASRWLNYYCWHIVSIYLLAMSAAFLAAAVGKVGVELPGFLTGLAVVFSGLCALIALRGHIRPWRFPASYLFLLVAASGAIGLIREGR